MKFLFVCFFITIPNLIFCQSSDVALRYLNLKKANTSPDSIEYMFLDCQSDDCKKVFKEYKRYKNLKGLFISNYSGKLETNNLGIFENLESVTIERSVQINLNKLFNKLSKNNNLKSLSLKDNSLIKLPNNITKLSNLKSINVSNNSNLKLEKAIELLTNLETLEEVYLPVNNILDLPNNISRLTNLKILDISNNYLESLPEGIKELRSLEQLSIEGNLIQDPIGELESKKNINLKYIALDNGLSTEDRTKLKRLFPNAEIKEVDTDELNELQSKSAEVDQRDTNLTERRTTADTELLMNESPQNDRKITYGEIKVSESNIKIYSQAYLHYPEIFKIQGFSNYDSTMFEERFLDTTYANVSKIQYSNMDGRSNSFSWNYEKFVLKRNKNGIKNENWFKFRGKGRSQSMLTKNNPELNAFIGMSWVLADNLSAKEFKKKYLTVKEYKWYNPRYWSYSRKWKFWTDVRITYDNEAQNFNLILKDLDGFTTITAYPRYNSLNQSLDVAQKTYTKRYTRYFKALNRREKRFERHSIKDKKQFKKNRMTAEDKKWQSFQKNYMSEEEKKVSKQDWLIYYDKVIANERKAMGNATASLDNITRSLDLDGYKNGYLWNDFEQNNIENRKDTSSIQPIKTLYQDKDSSMLAVKRILIIDKDTKSYQTFEGSLGIKMIRLNLIEGANVTFITELRNGNTGYLQSDVFKKINFPKNRKYKFTLNTINAKFGSVQMIREELKF